MQKIHASAMKTALAAVLVALAGAVPARSAASGSDPAVQWVAAPTTPVITGPASVYFYGTATYSAISAAVGTSYIQYEYVFTDDGEIWQWVRPVGMPILKYHTFQTMGTVQFRVRARCVQLMGNPQEGYWFDPISNWSSWASKTITVAQPTSGKIPRIEEIADEPQPDPRRPSM